MSVPLPTTTVLVRKAGARSLDAQRRLVDGNPAGTYGQSTYGLGPYGRQGGTTLGPFPAHVSTTPRYLPPDQRTDGQLREVAVQVDPSAWPIATGDVLEDADGSRYDVTTAVRRRGATALLDHVQVTAQRVTSG